jgi:hypothetical protein
MSGRRIVDEVVTRKLLELRAAARDEQRAAEQRYDAHVMTGSLHNARSSV